MSDNTFVFVVGNSPGKLKANSTRTVKSHISRQGWKSHTRTSLKSPKCSKQKNSAQTVTFEYQTAEEQASNAIEAIELWMTKQLSRDFQLGGGRVDPFRAYPGEQRPYIPSLVDHYLVHMAVDIPELDQPGNKGLLRTRWFPLVLSDLSCFQTVLLLSASNAASCHHTPAGCELLQMKSEAITSINDAFSDNEKRISDAVIGAVAKMASFEAMYGSPESYRIHMNGLYRMVMLRGGLDTLGLDGLLRRIILWIDLNSAFIFNSPRYFPRLNFDGKEEILEPNPERFVAP